MAEYFMIATTVNTVSSTEHGTILSTRVTLYTTQGNTHHLFQLKHLLQWQFTPSMKSHKVPEIHRKKHSDTQLIHHLQLTATHTHLYQLSFSPFGYWGNPKHRHISSQIWSQTEPSNGEAKSFSGFQTQHLWTVQPVAQSYPLGSLHKHLMPNRLIKRRPRHKLYGNVLI